LRTLLKGDEGGGRGSVDHPAMTCFLASHWTIYHLPYFIHYLDERVIARMTAVIDGSMVLDKPERGAKW